jgi:3-phosphoglycerate kinase
MMAQVSSKIGVIDSLMSKCDKLVIGGGMVFTFLKARGLNTGSSLVEEDKIDLAKELGEPLSLKRLALLLGDVGSSFSTQRTGTDAATQSAAAPAQRAFGRALLACRAP